MGSIQIEIVPGLSPGDVTLRYHGQETTPATDKVIQAGWSPTEPFQTLALRLIRGWLGYAGYGPSTPNFVWAADPTGATWEQAVILTGGGKGHFPATGGPPPPRARLEPVNAEIVTITEQTVLVDHAIWDNQRGADPRHYESSVNQSVTESVGSAWEKSQSVAVAAEIGVEVGGVGAKTSVAYNTSWGESHSVEKGQTLGTADSVSGELQPGQLSLAALIAKRGTLVVDVTYRFEALDGYLVAHTRGHRHGITTGQTVQVDLPDHPGYATEWIAVPYRDAVRVWYGRPYLTNTQRLTVGFFAEAEIGTYPLSGTTEDDIDAAARTDSQPIVVYPEHTPSMKAAS